ncbi:MAG: alginate export family protein [Parafilimonas sp.]
MFRLANRGSLLYLLILMPGINALRAQIIQYPSPIDTAIKNAADTTMKGKAIPSTLTFALDMRTRSEMRHGYKSLPTADTGAAFNISQRTRFNIDFKSKKIDVFLSLQDARVWGQQDPRAGQSGTGTASSSTTYSVYLFEAYAEPRFTDNFSVRIGRQRVMYDNQRLFAENDWRLAGNSHDAIRLIYNNKTNFTTELLAAYNQSGENVFTTKYSPGVPNYKSLVVHYLNWKVTDKFILTTINSADGYQSAEPGKYATTYERFTSGGRLEYSTENWYATAAAYYQYGKDSSGKKLGAFYVQPEVKYSNGPVTIRLGMEYLSGADSSTHPSKDKNFVPLYGVAHRFMGNLDYFASFPGDVNGAGLINPYLFVWYNKNKIGIRIESHLFYSQSRFVYKGNPVNKYLGFENDLRFNYKPNKFTDVETGFCWAAVTNSMTVIKKGGDTNAFPYFAYISLKLTPTLGKITF